MPRLLFKFSARPLPQLISVLGVNIPNRCQIPAWTRPNPAHYPGATFSLSYQCQSRSRKHSTTIRLRKIGFAWAPKLGIQKRDHDPGISFVIAYTNALHDLPTNHCLLLHVYSGMDVKTHGYWGSNEGIAMRSHGRGISPRQIRSILDLLGLPIGDCLPRQGF